MQSTPYVTFEQTRSYRVPVALLVAATCAAAGTAGVVMERGGAPPEVATPPTASHFRDLEANKRLGMRALGRAADERAMHAQSRPAPGR